VTVTGKRFVILATPRSGSNWLCTLLDSHPDILCHHELFNPAGVHIAWSQRGGTLDLSATAWECGTSMDLLAQAWSLPQGSAAVGFKLNIGQSKSVFEAVLNDPSIGKILVSRRNRVRAFLSERIAQISAQWESYPDSPAHAYHGPVDIAPDELAAHAVRNRTYQDELRARLAEENQEALEISYEAIGEPATQRRVLSFLGVDPDYPLYGRTRKMNSGSLEGLIANFPELQAALTGSDLAQDLLQEEDYD